MSKSKRKPSNSWKKGRSPYRDREFDRSDDDVQVRKGNSGMAKKPGYNDISWYAKNPEMLRDAATFSFNTRLGNRVDLFSGLTPYNDAAGGTNTVLADRTFHSIPGLMRLRFLPTIGVSTSSTSPANLAAQNIYSYVRYMNSGAKNYDQADLMLYLMAMDSIYMVWNWAKRIYGEVRTYSQYNRYMPLAYIAAELGQTGANAENMLASLQANLADYRARLNAAAARISSFCVPGVMSIFLRHSWMASNIYNDSNIAKAQQYIMVPSGYYVYNETSSPNGGFLKWNVFDYTTMKWDTVFDILNTMLDAVSYSEDIGVMSGDILKAYGQDKLFKISPVEPEYMVVPVYNEEVLNQIHNSRAHNFTVLSSSTLNITQDPNTGYLIWNPIFNPSSDQVPGFYEDEILLNMPWNNVTPENVMLGTRLTSIIESEPTGGLRFLQCGSEFIVSYSMYYFQTSASGGDALLNVVDTDNLQIMNPNAPNGNLEFISALTNFDWHPLFWIGVYTKTDSTYTVFVDGVIGDISNYTKVKNWQLAQLHETALLSEFNVPQIGSF